MGDICINGIPDCIPAAEAAIFRSRLLHAYEELLPHLQGKDAFIQIGSAAEMKTREPRSSESGREISPSQYSARTPAFTWKQLILPADLREELMTAIQVIRVEEKVFDQWGLRRIEPNPKTALNFYGKPGTGKTMAAHGIADFLNKKILVASYAEIESKYHGDGPKNVKALFQAAEQNDAVLFIDEADSLLSKRLTNVTQGSEQAINSMRSQLLINLEQFHGVVIFSTNLVENYDRAFETRISHFQFPMPDASCRFGIWKEHLPATLPLAPDLSITELASQVDDICGRDIKNAVIRTAIEAALKNTVITQDKLLTAVKRIKNSRIEPANRPEELNCKEKKRLEKRIGRALRKKGKAEQ